MDPSIESLLRSLTAIRDHYVADTSEGPLGERRRQLERLRGVNPPSSVSALESDLAGWLANNVNSTYRVKASAGQLGRRYALIPYAMLLRKDVTTSPTQGVYVALLFDQACSTLWLSLNQGISQFLERFGVNEATAALERAAQLIGGLLPELAGFAKGPILLGATYPFGKAYEVGAILSRPLKLHVLDEEFARAFSRQLLVLLSSYASVPAALARDPSLAGFSLNPESDEQRYQLQANRKISAAASEPGVDEVVPPRRTATKKVQVPQRNPSTAAQALNAAGHSCEAKCGAPSFIAAASGVAYMEAHHLVPIGRQCDFPDASVDVAANIVSLCPNCHAKVHRAKKPERDQLLKQLYALRASRLIKCGIACAIPRLLDMYGTIKPINLPIPLEIFDGT